MTEVSASNQPTTTKQKLVVDREKTCPFLLRIFCREGGHHRLEDYGEDKQPVENEVRLYTWKDATLKEISNLIKEINPDAQKHGARMSFKLVYQDNVRERYVFKDLGMVMNYKTSAEQDTTLDDARFVIGDFLDVALYYGTPQASRGPPERRVSGGGAFARNSNRDRERDRAPPPPFTGPVRGMDRERDRDRNGGRFDRGRIADREAFPDRERYDRERSDRDRFERDHRFERDRFERDRFERDRFERERYERERLDRERFDRSRENLERRDFRPYRDRRR